MLIFWYSRCSLSVVQAIIDGHRCCIGARAEDVEAQDDQNGVCGHRGLPLPPRTVRPPVEPDVHVRLEDDADECAEQGSD